MPIDPTPILLEGTPRQRGQIHGETLRPYIHDTISRWHADLRKNGKDPSAYMRAFLATRNFKPAFQRQVPGLLEEIEGIAEGANADYDTIYSLQLMDEYWVYDEGHTVGSTPTEGAHHCSGLGVHGEGGAPIIAQNMDLPGYYQYSQVVFHIRFPDSDMEMLFFSFAGCIGINALNIHGIGACLNTLIQLEACTDGLPVTGVLRGLAGCCTAGEADTFIRSVNHASGQNYIIGTPQGVTSYECSAHKVAAFAPLPTRTWHTNHPLVNDDCEHFRHLLETDREKTENEYRCSYDRLAYMQREVSDTSQAMTVERAQTILRSHEAPVCRNYVDDQHALTFGCLVMEMSVPPVLHVSFGPPCVNPFHTYRF